MRGFFMAVKAAGDEVHKDVIASRYLFTPENIPTMLNAHHRCIFMEKMGMDVIDVEHQRATEITELHQMAAEGLA